VGQENFYKEGDFPEKKVFVANIAPSSTA